MRQTVRYLIFVGAMTAISLGVAARTSHAGGVAADSRHRAADATKDHGATKDHDKTGALAAPPIPEPPEARAKREAATPRPPPFPEDPPLAKLPLKRRFDIGTDLLLVNRPAADTIDGAPSHIAYRPALGFGFHARIQVIRYLQVGAYFAGATHGFTSGQGALGVHGSIESDSLSTLWFGAKLMPTLPLGDYVRLFGTLGLGWGRFEVPQMTVREPGRASFIIKGRGNSFVEFPIGMGASFEVIENWLSVDVEITGSPTLSRKGTSFVPVQAIDNGRKRTIDSMAETHMSFVQSFGLSLLL